MYGKVQIKVSPPIQKLPNKHKSRRIKNSLEIVFIFFV